MGHTGYIDWNRLSRTFTDTRYGNTFVCAYWLVDYGRNQHDHGVSLLKGEGSHPDWFINAERADLTLRASVGLSITASPNVTEVFDTDQFDSSWTAKPLLASVLLGNADTTYVKDGHYWWCAMQDLTRPGRRMVKDLSMLYLRPPVIVSFLGLQPMKAVDPGAAGDSATVVIAPGHTI